METTEMREAAGRGAKLLDAILPGWENRVDTATLCMWNNYTCVLGQCVGEYKKGLIRLGLPLDDAIAVEYGFYAGEEIRYGLAPYLELAWCWRDEIAARLQR